MLLRPATAKDPEVACSICHTEGRVINSHQWAPRFLKAAVKCGGRDVRRMAKEGHVVLIKHVIEKTAWSKPSALTVVSYHHLQLSISRVQFCSSRGYLLKSIMHAAVVVILWRDTAMHHERQTRHKRYFLPPRVQKEKSVIFKLPGLFLNFETPVLQKWRIIAVI